MAVANQFGHIIVGQNGILSTPASSHMIVSRQAFGGIILSASHNPGGKNGDIGIKYDTEIGGSAQEELTNKFNQNAQQIDHYWMIHSDPVDLSRIGDYTIGSTLVEVVDSVSDYADYMAEIFDFNAIRELFKSGFKITFDAMNAVTGPYAKYIFETLLGAEAGSVIRGEPLPDFGGIHPEPNLTYAKDLVELAYSESAPDLCAASDGDGDRYMILGNRFFVSPADSLSIMSEYVEEIPFYKGKMYGVARSMPTANAVDFVMKEKELPVYATPTGWKFFSSLLDAKKITLCGEESFGTGSFHLCEKDGIWAILFWLNMIAVTGKSVRQLNEELWQKYGRVYNSAQSYEGLEKAQVQQMLDDFEQKMMSLNDKTFNTYHVKNVGLFNYTDPVTGDEANRQGYYVEFDNARIFMRLSGTGSSGATLRVYYMQYENNSDKLYQNAIEYLKPLASVFKEITQIKEYTGREEPNIVT
jgi:phosphoglucomutase